MTSMQQSPQTGIVDRIIQRIWSKQRAVGNEPEPFLSLCSECEKIIRNNTFSCDLCEQNYDGVGCECDTCYQFVCDRCEIIRCSNPRTEKDLEIIDYLENLEGDRDGFTTMDCYLGTALCMGPDFYGTRKFGMACNRVIRDAGPMFTEFQRSWLMFEDFSQSLPKMLKFCTSYREKGSLKEAPS